WQGLLSDSPSASVSSLEWRFLLRVFREYSHPSRTRRYSNRRYQWLVLITLSHLLLPVHSSGFSFYVEIVSYFISSTHLYDKLYLALKIGRASCRDRVYI